MRGMAEGATAADVPEDEDGERQPEPEVAQAGDVAEGFVANVIKSVAGHDEREAERDHAATGEAVFVRAPRGADVVGEERAEHDEGDHRGGTVEAEEPGLRGVVLRAESGVHAEPSGQHPPEDAGEEEEGEAAVEPEALAETDAKAVTRHDGASGRRAKRSVRGCRG